MRKICLILLIFVFTQMSPVFAQEIEFIYINGSNNNNKTMHKWFMTGIKNLHPMIIKKINKNPEMRKLMLEDGKYTIKKEPNTFFWGFASKDDLAFMTSRVQLLKGVSPWAAYKIRMFIADILHDAIWIQKTHNMVPILEELDTEVDKAAVEGRKVVLLGYSAGSFITYQYMFTKFPYLDLDEFFERHPVDKASMDYMQKNPRKNPCFFAFVASNLADVTGMGNVIPNKNPAEFREAYKNLDFYTDKYCVPEDVVYGVINFGSPIPLFYSDIADKRHEMSVYNKWLYKYLVEHDFFWLTVNYADDPLGFPNGVNLTNKEIEDATTLKINPQKGFLYDYSKTWSWTTTFGAHTSYWVTKRRFANAIVKGYLEGYKFQYDEECQKKLLKKNRNKYSLNCSVPKPEAR